MRILLLSTTTGYQLRAFGDAAERLGIELVLATDRCHLLEDPWRDGAVSVRFHDEEASLEAITDAVQHDGLSGVIAVGDRPTVLAARVAQAFGLHGNPPEAAAASRNKHLMRRRFAAAGLRVPWFIDVPLNADFGDVSGRVRYPCVVKPLGLSGSRGVIRADNPEQLRAAIARVRALLARPSVRVMRTGLEETLLFEGYIEGREYAIEGLITDGRVRVLAIFDKPDPLEGPFFEETIYVTPTAAPPDVQDAISETLQHAVTALGLVHGPIHAECRVGPEGVVILEVAARPIGGLCARALRFRERDSWIALEQLLLMHAAGMDVSGLSRDEQAAGVMMMPIPTRGVFKGVGGDELARVRPGVEDVQITAKPDQILEPLPEGDSYLGFVFARGQDAREVVSALRDAHGCMTFHIDRELKLLTPNA